VENFHRLKFYLFAAVILSLPKISVRAQTTEDLQRAFTELRFGMFIHYGILTFTNAPWATPNQDPGKFFPIHLNCNQWAEAAAEAKMKFAILTTKHHDGFCLWNSKYGKNSVASSPWKNGKGDVVREFVNAFRRHKIYPCFYYSIWDNTAGIGNGPITPHDMKVIEGQITELLTNYGSIKMLFIDGWSWKMGHIAVPYDKIRALVKKIQPGCLLVDNTHLQCLYENDMVHFEAGGACPDDNTLPALQSELINKDSGDDWFWDTRVPGAKLVSAKEIIDTLQYLEPKWCTFILNCPPNRDGNLDSNIVKRLKEVGNMWVPDIKRPPLPKQAEFIEKPVMPDSAWATSGIAKNAIDGINDRYFYSVWQSDSSLPQSITIDLGREYKGISILNYVPKYKVKATPVKDGSIESYIIYSSKDNKSFTKIAAGKWDGDTKMKVVTFPPVTARYIKVSALSAVNGYAAATEFEIGISFSKKWK
jgi:alpha-L-fucosidase